MNVQFVGAKAIHICDELVYDYGGKDLWWRSTVENEKVVSFQSSSQSITILSNEGQSFSGQVNHRNRTKKETNVNRRDIFYLFRLFLKPILSVRRATHHPNRSKIRGES